MIQEPVVLFAIIGALGIGSQWLAWRLRLPAIVLMLAAGLIAGPGLGVIAPGAAFGDLFRPLVAVAVAVILFEGGLTLKFSDLKEAGTAVRRLVFLGAPLGWLFAYLALRWGAGLSVEAAVVFGGILIVTGPTVIIPLLRQAKLAARPASILRWEGIVNDPVGALAAVLGFEVIAAIHGHGTFAEAAQHLAIGIIFASVAGVVGGIGLAAAFRRGMVPEYMKVPVLFGVVLVVYAGSDWLLHESGLLAVTVMGLVIANAHLPSFTELQRFKEQATVILVSGVFVMLAASLERSMILSLDMGALAAVVLIVFVARPLAVMLALIGSGLPWGEKLMVAWIGPRGVVAVAVSGLFGARLVELGIEDGALLTPLAFAIVAATVILHGFSIGPLARALGLTSTRPEGVILVGGSAWSTALGVELHEAGLPVLMVDRNYVSLRRARQAGLEVFHGEILSEAAEHSVPMSHYGTLIAATYNDDYNALICTDFGPEFGRNNVFQLGQGGGEDDGDRRVTLGGRQLGRGMGYDVFARAFAEGREFVTTRISEAYPLDAYLAERPDVEVIAAIRDGSGKVVFATDGKLPTIGAGDAVISLVDRKSGQEALA